MSRSSMDYFAPSGSTRVSSNSPSSTSSSFDSTGLDTAVPFSLFGNDNQPHNNRYWAFDNSSNNTILPDSSALFGSPHTATQQAVSAAAHQCPPPPIVQMRNLSLSPSPNYAPCEPVTFVSSSTLVAPQPVSCSPSLIGRGWLAPLSSPPALVDAFTSEPPAPGPPALPPRPQMQAKIPPEKIRKSHPCLHPGCGMKFRKRNALAQHMRSHTGERPEVCEFCSMAFSLKCNLRRHYRTCKEKKALEAAMATRKDTSSSPPPLEQSPSLTASSPRTTAFAPSHDSPPTDLLSVPPNLWSPGFNISPLHQPSTLAADMDYDTLFPTQFPTIYPYPALIQH
ncbi:hypothetical protein FRC04_001218 [Tulasnella sp. 424]|nr:hypothetical protein FRC04_001218 [Tulasnella sp. 424]KAG8969588.1 hypothetical protein FRC05_001019 [Tulasnella sp. 425]